MEPQCSIDLHGIKKREFGKNLFNAFFSELIIKHIGYSKKD
jgi:hypothetical protein